jgi:hypothetical protein|tara:strand:- start:368 stop:496 length:129 start_codon:yes stop_codon:yes gene_type:complete
MDREDNLLHALIGVALISGLFMLFFSYPGQAIINQFINLILK